MNSRVGWIVSNGELRYQPTLCVSRLSISLHLVKDGYVELYYQLPKNRYGLISDLVIKNEQCERFAFISFCKNVVFSNRASSIFSHRKQQSEEEISSNNDWRSKRFAVRRGQNVLIWTITSNNELTSLTDVIRLAKVDVVGEFFFNKFILIHLNILFFRSWLYPDLQPMSGWNSKWIRCIALCQLWSEFVQQTRIFKLPSVPNKRVFG